MVEFETTYETVLLRQQDARLHVTLNRPGVRNALSPTMIDELDNIFDVLRRRGDIKAVIVRGSGGHFCAGADLKKLGGIEPPAPGQRDPIAINNRKFGTLLERIMEAPQVIVAAVEGFALAGGLGLACASDVAIVTGDAVFGITEVVLGLVPAQMVPFVALRIGIPQTRHLALTAARFNGAEAVRLGIGHYLAKDSADLDARLEAVLRQIDRGGPLALAATKAILIEAARQPLSQVLDFAADTLARTLRGPEAPEGLKAFAEKRAPRWAAA